MVRRASAAVAISNDFTPLPDNPADSWLRKQYAQLEWKDIEHRVKTGQILDLVYDYEATDLDTMFAAPTQFSGKIKDITGRIIDEIKIDIQVPEDVVIAPQAAIVTQSMPNELYSKDRVPPHIAAAKIMLFFRNPYRKLWDLLAKNAITANEEEVRVYTIKSPDGKKEAEIRLHQGGKFLSYLYPDEHLRDGQNTYRDADGTRWKRVAAPAMTKGHNIRRYDDRLQWSLLHRSMSDDIFLTHVKERRRFRVDTLDVAKLVAQLDQSGQNRFLPGVGIDKKTGKHYDSFTLSSLMKTNTRNPNAQGRDEGVRMPDGSKYDESKAHADASYDVLATMALDAYLRKRAPDVVRTMEINSDLDRLKPFLLIDSEAEGFRTRPLLAFARNIYPDKACLHIGVCVSPNEEIDERKQAVLIRTDMDQPLEKYTYTINGVRKKLLDMSVQELAEMLKSQRNKSDAICEVIDLRKNPPVVPAQMAFGRGVGGDPDEHETNRRWVSAHAEFCRKLIEAHSMAMPPMPSYKNVPNPLPEDHLFTGIASAKWYEIDMGKGEKKLVLPNVHKKWERALDYNRAIDTALRRAIKPQPVEFEVRTDTIDAFKERMQEVDNALQKDWGIMDAAADAGDTKAKGKPAKSLFKELPPPDQPFIASKDDTTPAPKNPRRRVLSDEACTQLTANAAEYLWKLRAELMYEFHDTIMRFTVQQGIGHGKNRQWHDIEFSVLNKMNPAEQGDLANRIRTGEYRIHPEEIKFSWSKDLVARMFRDARRIEWVKNYMAEQGRDKEVREWEKWERHFTDLRALKINGAPHEKDPYKQRWMTATKGLKEVERIRNNFRPGVDVRAEDDEWGLADIFIRNRHRAEEILDACEKLYLRQLKENPLTKEAQRRLSYDPDNGGWPIEHAKYKVPAGAKILTIDVPDRVIDKYDEKECRLKPNFLSHPHVSYKFIMIDPDQAQRKALAEAGKRGSVVYLRGKQSGRTFYAAKPVVLSRKEINPDDRAFDEVYEDAATRFVDSGMKSPPANQFLPLAVEALEPVPSKVDREYLSLQTIKIPRWEDFMATVSPTLGYRDEQLTGLVIKKDSELTPLEGSARLQGMVENDGKPGQNESGWEVLTKITKVREMTLEKVCKWIDVGYEQFNAAAALGKDSVEAALAALLDKKIKEKDFKKAGFKSLESLNALMNKESFTLRDAVHYGYASLRDMKSKLTDMFVNQDLDKDDPGNLIHFVDIKKAKKEDMIWHRPARRPVVGVSDNKVESLPPSDAPATEPTLPTEAKAKPWTQVVRRRAGHMRSQ